MLEPVFSMRSDEERSDNRMRSDVNDYVDLAAVNTLRWMKLVTMLSR